MEEEYKYEESEATVSPPTVSPEAEENIVGGGEGKFAELQADILNKLKNIDWKRIRTPGIIVLSILFLYMVFSFYASKKSQESEQSKITSQDKVGFTKMNPVVREPVAPPVIQSSAPSNQQLGSLTQKITATQKQVAELSNKISQTQQDISVVNKNTEQLAMVMQKISEDVEKLKKPPRKKVVRKKAKAPVQYYIRAIVPGRVWLESATGKAVSLRVGDKLYGYGRVRMISPRQGVVVMSNGAVIQYGINES